MIYLYDIECIPNCFTAVFVEANQNNIIKDYIEADITNNVDKKGVHSGD